MAAAAAAGGMQPMPVSSSKDDLRVVNNLPRSCAPTQRGRRRMIIVLAVALLATIMAFTLWAKGGPDGRARAPLVLDGAALVFFAIGDWGRKGLENQVDVAAALGDVAARVHPSFIVSVGDNFYDYGVDTPTDLQFNASWRDVYTHPALASLKWYSEAGNHDYRGSLSSQTQFNDPRWVMPALNYTQQWSIPGANTTKTSCVYAVFIDTCPFISYYWAGKEDKGQMMANLNASDAEAQLAWASAELKRGAATCDALYVIGHHPMYSGGEHGDSVDLISAFSPLFVEYAVDAMLSGHDHTLSHLEANGTQFVITGAGSRVRDNSINTPETRFMTNEIPGFTVHSVNATHQAVAYVDAQGALLHWVITPLRSKAQSRGPRR